MDPATKGHRVKTCGDKQYCDKCGRSTGAKRKHSFWIANACQELETHRRSKEDIFFSLMEQHGPVVNVDSGVGPWARQIARALFSLVEGLS